MKVTTIVVVLFFVAVIVDATFLIVDWMRWEREQGPTLTTQGIVTSRTYRPGSYVPKIGDVPARHTPPAWKLQIHCSEIDTIFHLRGRKYYNRTTLHATVTVRYFASYKVRYDTEFNQDTQRNERVEVERVFTGFRLVGFN